MSVIIVGVRPRGGRQDCQGVGGQMLLCTSSHISHHKKCSVKTERLLENAGIPPNSLSISYDGAGQSWLESSCKLFCRYN